MFQVRKIARAINPFSSRRKDDAFVRPLDAAIGEHKAMLKRWESKQQKEIVAALLKEVFPAHHLQKYPGRQV